MTALGDDVGEQGVRSESREQEDKKRDYQLSTHTLGGTRYHSGVEKLVFVLYINMEY